MAKANKFGSKRTKRYDEGGDVEEDGIGSAIKQGMALKNAVGAKRETFGDAFKRSRASGEKTFEFEGKKYFDMGTVYNNQGLLNQKLELGCSVYLIDNHSVAI
jgi:hypothetical protein